jgi:hypothetical protein
MHWALAFIVTCIPLSQARQQILSLNSEVNQVISQHHLPVSILVQQNPSSRNCVILSNVVETQVHREIQSPSDTLVINKNMLNTVADPLQESVLEILAYDKRSLWAKVSEMCSAIHYELPPEIESYAEYEVVLECFSALN